MRKLNKKTLLRKNTVEAFAACDLCYARCFRDCTAGIPYASGTLLIVGDVSSTRASIGVPAITE